MPERQNCFASDALPRLSQELGGWDVAEWKRSLDDNFEMRTVLRRKHCRHCCYRVVINIKINSLSHI